MFGANEILQMAVETQRPGLAFCEAYVLGPYAPTQNGEQYCKSGRVAMDIAIATLKQALLITVFVFMMMLLIEYIHPWCLGAAVTTRRLASLHIGRLARGNSRMSGGICRRDAL